MDPSRKRKIRLVVALCAALLLAGALIYTSFSDSTEAKTPSQIAGARSSGAFEVTGKVVPGTVAHRGSRLLFSVRDRNGRGAALPVVYAGTVPDPFKEGREVIVKGSMRDGTFVAQRDSLVTKCPSKFQNAPGGKTY
jgi:cytochrome c-type biogenesis protein CcmE